MNHYGTHQLVTQLVGDSPGKAIDILTRCCEDPKILEEVTSYLLQPKARQYGTPTPPANRFDITFAPPLSPTSHSSHNTGTPPPRQRLPRRLSSTTYPLSPPGTASSVTSHSTRDGGGSGEYILLPTFVGGKVDELRVRMKTAPIAYSVIRDDVVGKRNLEDSFSLSPAEVAHVQVPHRVSGGVQTVPVSWSIDLTWRRPHSDSTHSTVFYLVPKEVLDIDMCLGYDDSGDASPDFTPTIVPQPQARQTPHFPEYKQEMRPHAPTPPSASYHRSAMTQNESHRASPVFHQDGQHHPYHIVEPFLARQQSYGAAMGAHQPSPAHTVLGSHIEHPQPLRPSTAPANSARETDPNKAADRIRLSLVWDATTLNVWLDLNAHGEAFYKAFQQQATKQRKDILDRVTMTILLKKDKSIPDEEAYALSLDEDDLDADWETTLGWLDANKRDKSPHVCGVVEMDNG